MAKATKASKSKRSSKKASTKSAAASSGSKGRRSPARKATAKRSGTKAGEGKAKARPQAKKSSGKSPATKSKARSKTQGKKKAVKAAKVAGATKKAPARKVAPAARADVAASGRPRKRSASAAAGSRPSRKRTRAPGAATPAAWNPVATVPESVTPATLPTFHPREAPAKFRRQYRTWLNRLLGLRRRLLGETSQLEEEALKAGEHDVSIDHMADYGSDSYEQEFTLSLIESKSEALRDVDEAIRKIDAGTYGLCEDCETLIPRERLEVLPHTRLCIECKSAQESAAGF